MGQTVDGILKYKEYEEALRQEAQKRLQTAQRAADTLYDQSVKNAEIQRGQAMTAADSAFDRSKSTYGLTAEYLAQSGLNNSGLSDNMMRDAYAARQSGYSAAGATYADLIDAAERTKAESYLNAELDYNDRTSLINEHLTNYKQSILNAYNTILEYVTPATTSDEINAYIANNGLSYDQAVNLYKKANKVPPTLVDYNNLFGTKSDPPSQEVVDGFASLKNDLAGVGIDGGTGVDEYKARFESLASDNSSQKTEFDEWVKANKDALIQKGIISQEWYDQKYPTSQMGKITLDSIKETIGGYSSKAKDLQLTDEDLAAIYEYLTSLNSQDLADGAEDVVKAFLGEKYGTSTVQSALVAKGYTIPSKFSAISGISNPQNFYKTEMHAKKVFTPSAGENFHVVDKDGKEYRVQIAEEATGEDFDKLKNAVQEGDVFVYGNTSYIKLGDKIYSIGQRTMGWFGQQSDYDSYADIIQRYMSENNLGEVSYDVVGTLETGNDVDVSDSLRRNYTLKVGSEITDSAILSAAAGLDDEKVFKVGDALYIKSGKGDAYKVYELKSKAGQGNSYKLLMENASEYTPSGFDQPVKDAQGETVVKSDYKVYNTGYHADTGRKTVIDGQFVKLNNDPYSPATAAAQAKNLGKDSFFEYDGNYYVYDGNDAYAIADDSKDIVNVIVAKKNGDYSAYTNASTSGTGNVFYKGADFTVKVGDKEYVVESGERTVFLEDNAIYDKIPKYSVFEIGGQLYYRGKNKVYKVDAVEREKHAGDYAELLKALGIGDSE